MVVFRAVENRIAFARSANTGISGLIDPSGRIMQATPIFTEQAISGHLPLRQTLTFYTRYGDAFAYACAIITAIFGIAADWRRSHAR
jgi:apolipoprotein N-acyltransferase